MRESEAEIKEMEDKVAQVGRERREGVCGGGGGAKKLKVAREGGERLLTSLRAGLSPGYPLLTYVFCHWVDMRTLSLIHLHDAARRPHLTFPPAVCHYKPTF